MSPDNVLSPPWSWGATPDETHAAREAATGIVLVRAVTVAAPGPVVFRWICQLKVAPYSYDLLDNRGRRSPRTLTPGADDLTAGEPMMSIFTLEGFVRNESLTLRMSDPRALRLFGPMTVTYRVAEAPGQPADGSTAAGTVRLVCVLDLLGGERALKPWRRWALAWGDLVMMRKQLFTIRDLSQRSSRNAVTRPAS